jgi:hypothetical protein
MYRVGKFVTELLENVVNSLMVLYSYQVTDDPFQPAYQDCQRQERQAIST